VGLNYNEDGVSSQPSATAMGLGGPNGDDSRFGDASAAIPYSATRKSMGLFTELVAPVTKELELSAAMRYDDYKNIDSALNGKLSFRYQPMRSLLVRGSVGTGFRAPTLRQLYRPLQTFGVTGDPFDCTPEMAQIAANLGAICRPPNTQYDVKTGGVPSIQPEKSSRPRWACASSPTISCRWARTSVGGYQGHVRVRRRGRGVCQRCQVREPVDDLPRPGDRQHLPGLQQQHHQPRQAVRLGIDFDIVGRSETPLGPLQTQLRATYVLRESRQLLTGGTYYSTLGDNNPSIGDVAFRWKGTLGNTLRMGNWQHTLNLNFQSGYQDFPADVYELDATGAIVAADTVRLKVKKYFTFDWQTAYSVNKALTLTVGVKNLFDKDPPLSLRTSGAHMLGFDYRYYSPLGRTWQAKLNLSF
jgi:iron complex outermembrane receptor protein